MPVRIRHATNNKSFHFLTLNWFFVFWLMYGLFIFHAPKTESDFIFLKSYDQRLMSECDHVEKYCVITKNPGGFFLQFMNTYQILSKNKYTVVLDGVCASSCTYLFNFLHLNNPKSVCVTKNAKFLVHAGSTPGMSNIPIHYVGKLQTLIDKKGGIARTDKIIYIKSDELKTIYRSCSGIQKS